MQNSPMWGMRHETSVEPAHLFSAPNRSWEFFCLRFFVCSSPSPHRLQLRKDTSSPSAAQSGDSPAAPTLADTPRLPESAAEEAEAEVGGPEGKIDGEAEEEAPKGAAFAQESTAKQDGVCG